ncbi:magnesium-translocating P-type ATPase [Micromonospora sonneratiae]|uniref:Magnesium-transporting ATPase, P-type 1 n=1 Tax=Micromonospora sonneratiae TaxID=1184706 RepID=A0ABW3YDA1_9ACTN
MPESREPDRASTGTARTPSPRSGASPVVQAAATGPEEVLTSLGGNRDGLTAGEAARRLTEHGPNVVSTYRLSALSVLARQLRSPLLALLLAAAAVSFVVGQRTDAVVIGVILAISVGFGFVNEYRAERTGASLHERIQHTAQVVRDGAVQRVNERDVVPGDLLRLGLGSVVAADVRLIEAERLVCDESVLTGESVTVVKQTAPVAPGAALADLTSCCLMGTVVRGGAGLGVVVATGADTEFGRVAAGLSRRRTETEFQTGLRRFSLMLARIAGVLTALIFVVNLFTHKPIIDAVLFSLAIAVGITPQLLPAVVTTTLATGSRRLAARRVLVKRLVCVEDLGNVEVLFTDKTGTLTEGTVRLRTTLNRDGQPDDRLLLLGLVAGDRDPAQRDDQDQGNPLDVALCQAPAAASQPVGDYRRIGVLPFDSDRRRVTVLVDTPHGRQLVVKGAPEEVMTLCTDVPPDGQAMLADQVAAGARVLTVATRPAPDLEHPTPQDERDLSFAGLLIFDDAVKAQARNALAQLARLGVAVKVITGDHPAVAERVCRDLGLTVTGVLTGKELGEIADGDLPATVAATTIFGRVGPDDKARIVHAQRSVGADVAFLGDGVNDAVALHTADVGISVDTATDVAKDAADVLLLEKDLGVLAQGVTEGRRAFANTIKYILMGTSSNFGNMFSAAGASTFLSFLPLLPSQILLNNLIYDLTQVAIPSDRVDPEQLARPAHWSLREIRRFMFIFGPLSSMFDFLTFALLLLLLHAGPPEFRSGWFVESLATQTLVIFVIRTQVSPFWRSRPSRPLLFAALAGVTVAVLLPYSPLAGTLGFTRLPSVFLIVVVVLVAVYLAMVETTKRILFSSSNLLRPAPGPRRPERPHRSAAARMINRFTTHHPRRRSRTVGAAA